MHQLSGLCNNEIPEMYFFHERGSLIMKICPYCDQPIDDGARFCGFCGAKTGEAGASADENNPFEAGSHGTAGSFESVPQAPVQDETQPYQQSFTEEQPYQQTGSGPAPYADPGSYGEVPYGTYEGGASGTYESGASGLPAQSSGNYADPYYGSAIVPRSIPLCIVLSLVTCGIYSLYWIYKMNDEINYLSGETEGTSGGLVLIYSILTCGIYTIYWGYRMGERVDLMRNMNGSSHILYLILLLTSGFSSGITSLVAYSLMQDSINKTLV